MAPFPPAKAHREAYEAAGPVVPRSKAWLLLQHGLVSVGATAEAELRTDLHVSGWCKAAEELLQPGEAAQFLPAPCCSRPSLPSALAPVFAVFAAPGRRARGGTRPLAAGIAAASATAWSLSTTSALSPLASCGVATPGPCESAPRPPLVAPARAACPNPVASLDSDGQIPFRILQAWRLWSLARR